MSGKINKVRIIGGEMRSRLITFPDALALRPTPDRVRETLFNWLGQTLYGRCCLDVFAGSGALSFEALSRGAEHVTLIDQNPAVVKMLQDNAKNLDCKNARIYCQDGLTFISKDTQKYDVIFLDPPYQSDYLAKLLSMLPTRLNPDGMLYVESGSALTPPEPWQLLKSGKAGQVHYQLLGLP